MAWGWVVGKMAGAWSLCLAALKALAGWVSTYLRDLFLFGGLVSLYLGLSGFDERWAMIVVGLLLIYLAVPRGVRPRDANERE